MEKYWLSDGLAYGMTPWLEFVCCYIFKASLLGFLYFECYFIPFPF
jgi:hypothetical protein